MGNQFIAFKLAQEEYAVDILAVKEIIRWTQITRVPRAPSFIYGVINLRGNVIPVINARARFQLPDCEITDRTRIIIFQVGELEIGFTVDGVTEVITLEKQMMEKPQMVEGNHRFIKNIGKLGKRLLMILDLSKLFDLNLV